MRFYVVLVKEYLACGSDSVIGCWIVRHGGFKSVGITAEDVQDMNVVRLADEFLISDLVHLHHAVAHKRSQNTMTAF